jgi:hypothetical protein
MRVLCLVPFAAIAALAGCATAADPAPTAEAHPQKVYRTGSNLPVRDEDTSATQVYKADPNVPLTPRPPTARSGG